MNKQPNLEAKWYVVYTYPNSEKKIHSELRRRALHAFLPTRRVIRQWSDRKKLLEVPLFPNYIFVKLTPEEMWLVLSVTGVVRFLSLDGQPVIVPNAEIEKVMMMAADDQGGCSENAAGKEVLLEGERVRVTHGPLEGLEGTLVSKNGASRLYVELNAIKRIISIEVPAGCVERVAEEVLC